MVPPKAAPSVTRIRLPYPVPYYPQVASPDLISAFFDERRDLATDPRWAESGALDPEEYALWAPRACGMACVKMVVEALGGPRRSIMDWVRLGTARSGYLIKQAGASEPEEELGWSHQVLAELVRESGLSAEAGAYTPEQILEHLRAGRMSIASVSYELGTDRRITRRGGHLVVVTGANASGKVPLVFTIDNPSGRTDKLRENAKIPIHRFRRAYSGRAIVVYVNSG